jgi:UDP-N-acetylenolpyruvoylglucosamine reductase
LLVRDGGIDGVVVHAAKGEFGEIRIRENQIEAGAGVRLKTLAAAAKVNGLGGFEWMEGIPGNVGGALRMNAGAMGLETFDQVLSVRYFDSETGEIREKRREGFAYRYRSTPELEENYALSAVFEGYPDRLDGIQQRLDASQTKRRGTQPSGASAGCMFKNPEGMSAGRLVEELGLKGERCGGARVSEVHGNFIVNDSGASAAEVLELIERVRDRAWKERCIRLETEVEIVGEDKPAFEAFAKP